MERSRVRMTSCRFSYRWLLFGLACLASFFPCAQTVIPPFRLYAPDSISVKIEPLPHNINTNFSEYCGVLLPDSTFLFTSMRNDANNDREHFFETNWYCYIYSSKIVDKENNLRFSTSVALPQGINNHNFFNSNFSVNKKGDRMFFSRCVRQGEGDLYCSLWQSTKHNGKWSKPEKLPENINVPEYSSLQPNFVEYSDYQVLYFVSNRPGGYGGCDIWYSIEKDDEFQPAINVGPVVNTEGNEVTPFYDKDSRTLFFSCDERKGYGDYDIWSANGALSSWKTPLILEKPFNSEYNDIYFTLNPDRESAIISSNRLYDNMIEDTCCNDLYYVKWKKIEKETVEEEPSISIREKIASVLPIALYFQNDSPDPRSLSDTTNSSYLELYNSYVSDIQKYIKKSGEGLEGDEQRAAMYAVSAFMRDSVQSSYNRLLLLTKYLNEAVENGDTVALKIQGFASPLHNDQYNKHLSNRRIVSLLNFLKECEGGKLAPYLTGQKRGIDIEVRPEGAVQHSFESDEVRETVFGLRAAKDRKIVISEL